MNYMKSKAGFIYVICLSGSILLSVFGANSAEIDPYPTVIIPILRGAITFKNILMLPKKPSLFVITSKPATLRLKCSNFTTPILTEEVGGPRLRSAKEIGRVSIREQKQLDPFQDNYSPPGSIQNLI